MMILPCIYRGLEKPGREDNNNDHYSLATKTKLYNKQNFVHDEVGISPNK